MIKTATLYAAIAGLSVCSANPTFDSSKPMNGADNFCQFQVFLVQQAMYTARDGVSVRMDIQRLRRTAPRYNFSPEQVGYSIDSLFLGYDIVDSYPYSDELPGYAEADIDKRCHKKFD